MKNISKSELIYYRSDALLDLKDFSGARNVIKNNLDLFVNIEELALAYTICGFINNKLGDYHSAIDDFSKSIFFESKYNVLHDRSRDISYNGRSNSKYFYGDYKGSIEDKINAKRLRRIENIISSDKDPQWIDYYKIYKTNKDINFIKTPFNVLSKISLLLRSKYDLINDFKKNLGKAKLKEIKINLEKLSDSKYKKGEYKASIRAIRRAEKYY